MEGIPDPHNVALGRAIRRSRDEAGLTQEELAAQAQMPIAELSLIEDGGIEADWGTLRHIAYGLDMDLPDLLRRAEDPASP
jgi:transcriptional regulator with XRE-family HTH domain